MSLMHRIDALVSHVWMVRTFIKHSEELEDDPELSEVQHTLYDYMLALGPAWKAQDEEAYLKQAKKKLSKLRQAADDFSELQPDVSTHMNFQMAVRSLQCAVAKIEAVLSEDRVRGREGEGEGEREREKERERERERET